MDLPVVLERKYGLMNRRLFAGVHEVGLAAVNYAWTKRQDQSETDLESESENGAGTAALLAAMAALGITLDTLLDETQLRNALRRVAKSNDQNVKRQLAGALGRPVNFNASAEINAWVDSQVERIQKLVNVWYDDVVVAIESPPQDMDFEKMTMALVEKKTKAERNAFLGAATGLLLLNASLVTANAVSQGLESYIWRTEGDERVREHHVELEGTVQNFASPPPGGGTSDGDIGNPGEGINCRCVAEIIIV